MDTVEITWSKGFIAWSNLAQSKEPALDSPGFFAILVAELLTLSFLPLPIPRTRRRTEKYKLLYIDHAFGQSLRDRILEPHKEYDCVQSEVKGTPHAGAVVMVGIITSKNVKITQTLMDDVECCLVKSNRPPCNESNAERHIHRDLKVTNFGDYAPLIATSQSKQQSA